MLSAVLGAVRRFVASALFYLLSAASRSPSARG